MTVTLALMLAVLARSVWCYSEDLYPAADNPEPYPYADEYPDDELEMHRRNSNFLRFGRGGGAASVSGRHRDDYDDYSEDFARPTRSGSADKSDHFIRFGRSKQDFLRFGRVARDRSSNYLRFGRSASDEKRRSKRDAYSEYKRGGSSNFLRFGRNSNFLRFGRNEGAPATAAGPEDALDKIKQFRDSPLAQFLAELVDNVKKEQNKCGSSA